ncbi:cache domain-containing sensor histidine kinase [Cohnella soli]|uniref:histidine kinase n=1 Tax=Cohnella soli TaxID=425005 RepID=A0ABW0I3W9_9BACL
MTLIRRFYRRFTSKLLYKMILIYSLLTVVPLIVVISLFYFRSTDIIETKIQTSSNQTLVETSDKIDGMLKLIEQKTNRLSTNLSIHKLLRNDMDKLEYALTPEERRQYTADLDKALNAELAEEELIDAIYIFDNEENIYTSTGAETVTSYLALQYIAHQVPGSLSWAFFTDHSRIAAALEIYDESTDQKLGYLAVMLKPDKFKDAFASYSYGSFYIVNSNNLILASHDTASIGEKLKPSIVTAGNILNKRTSLYSGFTYYSIIPKRFLQKEIENLAYYAAAITVVAWFIVFVLTVVILRHITQPLMRLTGLMRKAEREHFEPLSGIRTTDEIALLCNSFNRLIREIQFLIQKVYKAELLKKEANLKAIKMHINPHFLYNTLETVSIMAKAEGAKDVPEVIQKLSRILRFSISGENDFIPLDTEMSMLLSYLQLHKYRFKDRLHWEIAVDPALSNVTVPKLIIQPIVENAIIHGVNQIEGPGFIHVRAYVSDYDLWMEVEDNGPGIDYSDVKVKTASGGLGSGMANVSSRIAIYYGYPYGVTSENKRTGGTIIKVRLPITG